MRLSEFQMTRSLIVRWNSRTNLFLRAAKGSQWYWVERSRAVYIQSILETMEALVQRGETVQKSEYPPVSLTQHNWSFLLEAREAGELAEGEELVAIGDFVTLKLYGDVNDLEWLI